MANLLDWADVKHGAEVEVWRLSVRLLAEGKKHANARVEMMRTIFGI